MIEFGCGFRVAQHDDGTYISGTNSFYDGNSLTQNNSANSSGATWPVAGSANSGSRSAGGWNFWTYGSA